MNITNLWHWEEACARVRRFVRRLCHRPQRVQVSDLFRADWAGRDACDKDLFR